MLRIGLGAFMGLVLAMPAWGQAPIVYAGPPAVIQPVTYFQPVTTYYRAPVSYYQPAVSYYQPAVSYYEPTVSYYQPAPVVTYYQPAPVVSYYQPAPVVYSSPGPVAVTTYRYGLLGRRSATVVNYGGW